MTKNDVWGSYGTYISRNQNVSTSRSFSLKGFIGFSADFLDKYKPYIEDGQTVITSLPKIYGPDANDLVLHLRKQGITRVIPAGIFSNLCVESHMRKLIDKDMNWR